MLHLVLTEAAVAAEVAAAGRVGGGAGRRGLQLAALRRLAAELAARHGLLVVVPEYSRLENLPPDPSVKLCVHAGLGEADAGAVADALARAARDVLEGGRARRR